MKTPSDIIWALTKRNSSYLVKFNGNQWTHNPLSSTGLHNASSANSTINVVSSHKKTEKKKFKRTFSLLLQHGEKHGVKKTRSAKSQSLISHSKHDLNHEVHAASKTIGKLTFQNQKEKNRALRRLARLSATTRLNVPNKKVWTRSWSSATKVWYGLVMSRVVVAKLYVEAALSPDCPQVHAIVFYRGFNCIRG